LDGRAEAGLQVQGAGLSTVGIGSVPSGVSSGTGVTQHSIDSTPFHRTDSNKTPHKSKNSELARANNRKIYCLTIVNRPRTTRTIGDTQTSCVDPDSYENPRQNGRGGVVGNMFDSVHAQSGGWAGKDTNVCTHGYIDFPTTVIGSIGNYGNRWNELKGYVHKLVPAQIERYRNIGVWRCKGDAHLSVHAQSEKNRNIGVRSSWGAVHSSMHARLWSWQDASEGRYKQIERWGQFKLRNPPNANLPPEEISRRPWIPRPRRSCGNRSPIWHWRPRIHRDQTDACVVFARLPVSYHQESVE